jgi:formylglycine-generating enzyme required for sulfatase activity
MSNKSGTSEQTASLLMGKAAALTEIDRLRLLQAVSRYFSEEELRTLCYELEIDYDDLPARGKTSKARELIFHCERTRQLGDLIALCQEKRPLVDWPAFVRPNLDTLAPFKGLEFYDVADAGLFYGREALAREFVEHLCHHRFLAVVGASGSGKSSIVRAGLIPALQGKPPPDFDGGLPPDSLSWPIHIFTPTAQPLKELATRLTMDSESVRATTQLIDDMIQEPRSLDIALTRLASRLSAKRILLIIDQFEELFTLCRDEPERQAFIDNLVTAVKPESTGPAVIVITLRADFYGHCLQYHSFHKLLEQQQKIVGPMTAVELRQVIEMPAKSHGLTLEPGLVELFLRDVGASGDRPPEPGALPLLSHALLETWRRREGQALTLAGYHAAGGVQGAIARTADATYRQLSADQQTIARNIFLRLTELSEGPQDTRRRANLSELIPQQDNALAVIEILKLLVDARLVTTHEETAEVAHEALIREWPVLRQWLEENRAGLRLYRQLTQATQTWKDNNQDKSYLYRGARLAAAKAGVKELSLDLTAVEQAFLQVSARTEATSRLAAVAGMVAAVVVITMVTTLAATGQLNRLIFRPPPLEWVEIPAGESIMGSSDAEVSLAWELPNDLPLGTIYLLPNERPQRSIYVDGFAIGRYEVTNMQYRQCVRATICSAPSNDQYRDPAFAWLPVTNVDWHQAATFCQWVDGRLPTEVEWEKAARGSGATGTLLFPWGNDPDPQKANVGRGANGSPLVVGSFSPAGDSAYGVADMAGNVAEWVYDAYAADAYQSLEPYHPRRPQEGEAGLYRGGSFFQDWVHARSAHREIANPNFNDFYAGFRCAR